MFLSTSYVYYREVTLDEDMLNITAMKNEDEYDGKISGDFSDKADNVKGIRKSKSLNSLNYDGDTDSINENDDRIHYEDIKLKCTICNLEYNAYLELPSRQDFKDGFIDKKKIKRHRKKKSKKHANDDDEEDEDYRKVNFEEYKDWAHRMEEFDPKAERKWTLEYNVNHELPRLSKIIVGRGHDNEFPELNNVHLFDDIRLYEKSSWRNSLLKSLKQSNLKVQTEYSLIPSNQTCLFCFTERQSLIQQSQCESYSSIPILSMSTDVSVAETTAEQTHRISKHCKINDLSLENLNLNRPSRTQSDEVRSKIIDTKKKLTNVFKGKSITKIIRSQKHNSTEKTVDDDNEEFEIL